MQQSQNPQTWRELLGKHLNDPQERKRIADATGVNPLTLSRWVNSESSPRPRSLQRLLMALPQQHELLLSLIEEEFKEFSSSLDRETQQIAFLTIPVEFYIRILHTLTTLPRNIRFSSLTDLILQQALNHLDPQRLGLASIVASCLPSSFDGKVRSLRERVGRGTPPWSGFLEQHALLLGAESLAGQATTSRHRESNPRLKDGSGVAPGYQGPWEESAVAVPILHMGDVAGCLLVSSTLPGYFTLERCILIEQYAELLSLAFDTKDFYEPAHIELRVMPPPDVQHPYLVTFQNRLMQTITGAQRNRQPMTLMQAEQLVWQQIEQNLFERALPSV